LEDIRRMVDRLHFSLSFGGRDMGVPALDRDREENFVKEGV